jgi:hypothetical protein
MQVGDEYRLDATSKRDLVSLARKFSLSADWRRTGLTKSVPA